MPGTLVDTLIVGQGLAGTTLAWQLGWRGQSVLVVDQDSPNTASKIAAGLVTPITGQRLVPSWRFDEFWPAALEFYGRVEKETGRACFREIPMVRLFKSAADRDHVLEHASLVSFPKPLVDEAQFTSPWGGFEMRGGQLDVPAFLESSRKAFQARGQYRTASLNLPEDLQFGADGVFLPALGLLAKRVIFCQGFAGRDNPWFHCVPFDPAKGEILTIRVPGLEERRVIHRGIWLAPLGNEMFRAGATYDREHWDDCPTTAGKAEILAQLESLLKLPFEVLDHQAAVRPIVIGRHPVIGLHPRFPGLGYFNGLASKGSLQAPFIAEQFAAFLQGEGEIEQSLDIQKRFGEAIWND
jgi:glycine/D-amino acid oxidase-like deaminating enzyme